MSGPKVVRVRSREELELEGRQLLGRVDDALEQLQRVSKRAGVLEPETQARLGQRRARLESLFGSQRWAELANEVGREVGFLQGEVERVRVAAAAAVESSRSRRIRASSAANTLIESFRRAGREPPAGLSDVRNGVASADDLGLSAMEGVLSEALRQLLPPTQVAEAAQATALASRLSADQRRQSVAEWLSTQPQQSSELDPRLRGLLAQVESLVTGDAANGFIERASLVALEPESGRRALLTDSLALDLGDYLQRLRGQDVLAASLRSVERELRALGSTRARALAARVSEAVAIAQASSMKVVLDEAKKVLEEERREFVASTRRRAVLAGLSSLGYQVEETMELALPTRGRIVLHKPGVPDYGVELAVPPDATKMQVQLVGSDRPEAPRDVRRDKDMETIWCADLQKLRATMSGGGSDLAIEFAVPVGAQPVKTVAFARADDAIASAVRPLGSRTVK